MPENRRMKRHIAWNWEQSPDNPELVRCHFVVVDDKDREGIMARVIEQLTNAGSIEQIRSGEGKVEGTKFRYLFRTYDSYGVPTKTYWHKIGKSVRRDLELRERKRGNIEDYVAEKYS